MVESFLAKAIGPKFAITRGTMDLNVQIPGSSLTKVRL
jgi:hypothetical protein